MICISCKEEFASEATEIAAVLNRVDGSVLYWPLCREHARFGQTDGWDPVPIDSEAGKARLAKMNSTRHIGPSGIPIPLSPPTRTERPNGAQPICMNCAFYRGRYAIIRGKDKIENGAGQCRHGHPRVFDRSWTHPEGGPQFETRTEWPEVMFDDWCGDWKAES
jgi:hypothetical protein